MNMRCSVVYTFGSFLMLCILALAYGSKKCYHAKTCIHNGNEKCGVDSKGNVRRFLDGCDIKEFNCLKDTDYDKTDMAKCSDLPPIPPEEKKKIAKEEHA